VRAEKLTEVRILIIGGASLDTLDGADDLVAGGAGMYTAMASHRSGASVTLYAPRPDPIPDALQLVANSLEWLGPSVALQDFAHFEITYTDSQAVYVQSHFGGEEALSPKEMPGDLSGFDCVHLIPLGDLRQQHSFMLTCRERGARLVSAGTALHLINEQPDDAVNVLQGSDLFFMNEEEAVRLFGSMDAVNSRPGQTIFVTRGRAGATVIQGDVATHLDGVRASVVDPTGAGDTFCGATLANLASGYHPVMAARQAMPLSAQMTEGVGPSALLRSSPPPKPLPDQRVIVNPENIVRIAEHIAGVTDITPFAFTGPDLPAPDHPAALDYFFASTLQQFSFWTATADRYERPLIATVDGEERKGAFYLFRAYLRWLENDPEMLTPARQADLTRADMLAVLRADDGTDPMPALDLHLDLARQYGRDMLALDLTPLAMLQQANASASPLRSLLQFLDHVGGYKEDPLRKKTGLLAIILQQRPEAFLSNGEDEVPPVVDYHVMRSCLRTGLIDVTNDELKAKLVGRQLLSADKEWAVRAAAHMAIEQVVEKSGKSMGAVDWFFFQARQRCPEMSEPQCDLCAVDPVCAHRKELFQPVRRTTYY
jgi:sugar/nucleoside kinase (ribokinase family)